MQGGARKAAMAGFFFFTKNGWTGQRPPPAAHRAHRAGLTILPTIPADTRAPPARQAGFMPGSDRCAAILVPSRARQAAKSSDAGTEAGAVPPPPTGASGRPDDFADHSCGYPRPSRAAGRPDDFADHSCGYPRPSRARRAGLTISPTIPPDTRAPPARQAGFMPGSDRCAATLVPSRARQTAKASGAGTEAGAVPPPPTALIGPA